MRASDEAIIYPWISKSTFFWICAAASVLIIGLVFLCPAELPACSEGCEFSRWLYSIATKIPGTRGLAIQSNQPFVLAISYFSSVATGLFFGVLVCFCSADMKAFRLYMNGITRTKRILYLVGMCFFLWLIIFKESAETNSYQFSHGFWESLKNSRFTLLYFSFGTSGFVCGSVFWIVSELVSFLNIKRINV